MTPEMRQVLAVCLERHFLHSFHVREYKLLNYSVSGGHLAPRVVDDLRNFRKWNGGEFDGLDMMSHAIALRDIITRGAEDIRKIAAEARKAEDPDPYLKMAKEVQEEMESAEFLLEKLSGTEN